MLGGGVERWCWEVVWGGDVEKWCWEVVLRIGVRK